MTGGFRKKREDERPPLPIPFQQRKIKKKNTLQPWSIIPLIDVDVFNPSENILGV